MSKLQDLASKFENLLAMADLMTILAENCNRNP
jgi:hypothetical protein